MVETTSKAVPEDSNLPEARTHDRQVRKIPWRGRAAPRIEIEVPSVGRSGERRLVGVSFAGV
jgi:hypothetical protein